ncbi:uncharacterized protein LOC130680766 [Manis pentadactyla]|uniref:uncharacterized protein LOC130680766 n=1 Tax=Manis pentadactyla TaxID=143292 RepID=UPI00255C3CBF|nr:uncharacterized protein LOC130680766 [Manis pentadactyla]
MTVYILDVRYYFLGVVEGEDVNCTVGTLLLKKHFFSPWIKSFAIAPSMDLTDTFSRKSSCPFPLEDSMLVLGAFDLLLFLISFAIVAKPPRTQYTHNVMQQCFLSLQVASRRDRNNVGNMDRTSPSSLSGSSAFRVKGPWDPITTPAEDCDVETFLSGSSDEEDCPVTELLPMDQPEETMPVDEEEPVALSEMASGTSESDLYPPKQHSSQYELSQ